MRAAVKKVIAEEMPRVLIGTANPSIPRQIAQKVKHLVDPESVCCAMSLESLREMARQEAPDIIILDDEIFDDAPLAETLTEFTSIAPVILVAPYHREREVAQLIAAGQVEFVPHANHWPLLAASLAERRLRWAEKTGGLVASPGGSREDLREIFRHEINNPLTGILGNAELLLAHSDHLPAAQTQRLRTVVELAVRLRETVRRVSNSWERAAGSKPGNVTSKPLLSDTTASEQP